MTRLLVAAYFLEAGLLLAIAPWTIWWRSNFFADRWPWLDLLMTTRVAQAGVVLTGALTILAGLVELYDLWSGRAHRRAAMTPDPRREP